MKHRHFVTLFGLIFLICVVFMLVPEKISGATVAQIYASGELVCEIDLDSISAPYEIPVINNGGKNIILAENDGISIKSADCPDKLCVRQGKLTGTSAPIVCLPNEVYIVLKSKEASKTDAISR